MSRQRAPVDQVQERGRDQHAKRQFHHNSHASRLAESDPDAAGRALSIRSASSGWEGDMNVRKRRTRATGPHDPKRIYNGSGVGE